MSEPAYCAFYCEENIWHLAADPRVGEGPRAVWLISSPTRKVALWRQRAGDDAHQGLVVWDYHVVLHSADMLWDLDTTLGAPVPVHTYLAETFRGAPEPFRPLFRVMEAPEYRDAFASDRRHMRGEDGAFVKPPPPWPTIGQGHTLPDLLDFRRAQPGRIMDLDQLVAHLGAG